MIGPGRRVYAGWMRAIWWSICAVCRRRINEGEWQGLAHVPEVGRRWVHEECALRIGPAGAPTRPEAAS